MSIFNMKEQEFFKKFDMQVQPSHRKLRRIPNMWQHTNAWNITVSDNAMYQHQTFPIEEVECVEVLMPQDRLQHIIDYINYCEDTVERAQTDRQLMARYEQDRSVRLNNPAVEKAYQKYVILLEFARK
jgi:predicted metalloenzyme YecM